MTTPTPWDQPSSRGRLPSDAGSHSYNPRESRDPYSRRESRDTSNHRERVERLTSVTRPQHTRNDSIAESAAQSAAQSAAAADYPDAQHQVNGRRHDYDVQAMESDLSPRAPPTKNPIPAPTVSIRSEFPTLSRSRQQQSLACLITVEVPEGNWSPDAEDLRHSSGNAAVPQDEPMGIMRFPTVRTSRSSQFEPQQENLDDAAEDLRTRVDNWHGLEFHRYVNFPLYLCVMLGFLTSVDLANCVYMATCALEKTVNRGKSWNATYSLRCSSVSRRSACRTAITNTMTCRRSQPGLHLRAPF